MSNLKNIRTQLKLTQGQLGEVIKRTKGAVSQYEAGATFPPDCAQLLIEYAERNGVALSYDDIYRTVQGEAA